MNAQLYGTLGGQATNMVVRGEYLSDDLFKHSKQAMMVYIDNNDITKAIPPEVIAQIKDGKYVVNNHIVYAVKKIDNKTTIKLIESGDKKKVGLSNITNGLLDKDMFFCVTGMVLLIGATPAGEEAEALVASFESISNRPALVNGVHRLKGVSGKNIIDNMPNYVFDTPQHGGHRNGIYYLDTPRLLEPQKEIMLEIDVPALTGLDPDKDFLKTMLVGTAIMPA